jgi:hypothetical protein
VGGGNRRQATPGLMRGSQGRVLFPPPPFLHTRGLLRMPHVCALEAPVQDADGEGCGLWWWAYWAVRGASGILPWSRQQSRAQEVSHDSAETVPNCGR